MVSGSPDATIAIFDLSSKNEKALKTVKQHEYKIFSVAVNKEEKLMVSSASGSEIIFWDFNKMKVLKREKANAWIVYNSKFIEGTNYIATGQSNG
jgi:WD40 repeat protein